MTRRCHDGGPHQTSGAWDSERINVLGLPGAYFREQWCERAEMLATTLTSHNGPAGPLCGDVGHDVGQEGRR